MTGEGEGEFRVPAPGDIVFGRLLGSGLDAVGILWDYVQVADTLRNEFRYRVARLDKVHTWKGLIPPVVPLFTLRLATEAEEAAWRLGGEASNA